MSYFVFGETVTASRINQFIDNDEALRAGSGLAASAVTPEKLFTGTGTDWVWDSYTPTWANLTVGNGTNVGKYIQIGKTVIFKASIVWGSSTSLSGIVTVTKPITEATLVGGSLKHAIGNSIAQDGSNVLPGPLLNESTTLARPVTTLTGVAGANVTVSSITGTAPATWNTGDEFNVTGVYEAS